GSVIEIRFQSYGMNVDIGQLEDGPPRFFQRLFPGHSDIREQMRIVGEVAEQLALAVPSQSKAPSAPASGERRSPIFLMKSRARWGRPHDQRQHRQAPKLVKYRFRTFQ